MTGDLGGVRGQLWPIPAQMHQNIDNWVAHVQELEEAKRTSEAAAVAREKVLSEHIAKLRTEMANNEKPLLEQVSKLEAANLELRAQITAIRNEVEAATRVLAAATETAGTRLSLLALANDAALLFEESKRVFRANL